MAQKWRTAEEQRADIVELWKAVAARRRVDARNGSEHQALKNTEVLAEYRP